MEEKLRRLAPRPPGPPGPSGPPGPPGPPASLAPTPDVSSKKLTELEDKCKEITKEKDESKEEIKREVEENNKLKKSNETLESNLLKMMEANADLQEQLAEKNKEGKDSNEMEMLRKENKRMKEKFIKQNGVLVDEQLLKEKEKLESRRREQEEKLNSVDDLNMSIESEKRAKESAERQREVLEKELVDLRESIEQRQKKAKVVMNLEMGSMKSKLERTKLRLKESQETRLKMATEEFEEHEEMLEALRAMSGRKRKRVVKKLYEQSGKKMRLEELEETVVDTKDEINSTDVEKNDTKANYVDKLPTDEELALQKEEDEIRKLEFELAMENNLPNLEDSSPAPSPNLSREAPSPNLSREALLTSTPAQKRRKNSKPKKIQNPPKTVSSNWWEKSGENETSEDKKVTAGEVFEPPSTLDAIFSALEDIC